MWQPPERIKHKLPDPHWPTAAEAATSMLFQPVRIGSLTATQRTWVPAMVPWRATEEGYVTDDVIDWYRRFAEGKPGVIVVEATGIRDIPSGPLLRIGHDRFIPGLRDLTRAVREASGGQTKLFIQCIDFLTIRRRPPREKFLHRFLHVTDDHRRRLATFTNESDWMTMDDGSVRDKIATLDPNDLPGILSKRELDDLNYGYRERVWDTHLAHVAELPRVLPRLFADAANRAFESGFDGVELHYAHAYTMASFLSGLNRRDDGYGGSRERRVRLPLEVIAAVRERIGKQRVLGLRFLGEEVIEGGYGIDDAVFYGVQFANAGVDFVSVSKGGKFEDAKQPRVGEAVYPYTGRSGYECMPTIYSDANGPFARNVSLSAAIRQGIRDAGHDIPVVTAGGICTFEHAEAILQDSHADIIGSARQTLADPDWFLKMQLGRGDEIRRCHFTNYCEALDQKHRQVTCKLWDREDIDRPDVKLCHRGRRRLIAPEWQP